jgi:hypothetical protein
MNEAIKEMVKVRWHREEERDEVFVLLNNMPLAFQLHGYFNDAFLYPIASGWTRLFSLF